MHSWSLFTTKAKLSSLFQTWVCTLVYVYQECLGLSEYDACPKPPETWTFYMIYPGLTSERISQLPRFRLREVVLIQQDSLLKIFQAPWEVLLPTRNWDFKTVVCVLHYLHNISLQRWQRVLWRSSKYTRQARQDNSRQAQQGKHSKTRSQRLKP